jgi:hypothetical protein
MSLLRFGASAHVIGSAVAKKKTVRKKHARASAGDAVRLTVADLRRGFRKREFDPRAMYRFYYSDLLRANREDPPCEIGPDDLVFEVGDGERKQPEKVCPCVLVVIVGTSPSDDGKGQPCSRWGDGAWNKEKNPVFATKNKANFQKLLADALALAGFADHCINVRELKLTDAKYQPFFYRNQAGELTELFDRDASAQTFARTIRADLGAEGTERCITLIMVSKFIRGSAPGEKSKATTVYDVKAGTKPNTWQLVSENVSVITDAAASWAIAHEIFHQAGVTHSKDNIIHPGADGQPDHRVIPKEQERERDDLMHPTPQATGKPNATDVAKLRDHAKAKKCCDIKKPLDSSVI